MQLRSKVLRIHHLADTVALGMSESKSETCLPAVFPLARQNPHPTQRLSTGTARACDRAVPASLRIGSAGCPGEGASAAVQLPDRGHPSAGNASAWTDSRRLARLALPESRT